MKRIMLVIFGILICCSAYSKKHKHQKSQQPGSEITSVTMHRTACYGRCPDYTIEINKNGMVTYTAMRFTPDTGIFEKNIGIGKSMEIINQFAIYRVDTCSDAYRTRIQDIPALLLIINYKDSVKTIRNANFGPVFLKQLANTMDAIGKKTDDSWKKTGMPKIN